MTRIEKEINLLEKKKDYIAEAFHKLHKQFFEDNSDVDPDRTEESASNSGLTIWIIKHALDEGIILPEDIWYILRLLADSVKDI